ncbi:MAG: hypothetical protein HY290_06855 [Planctomycetia bacterium]|nr:hypothetical protein [Planctomycetia bacterium]
MSQFQTTWIVSLVALLIAFMLVGTWIKKQPLGILIDAQCRMSLSRLQVVLWTWLLISAFFAIAFTFKSMEIQIATEIWALMGISVGSAAGSVIVKGTKAGQQPSDAVPQNLRNLARQGVLPTKPEPKDASLSDLFTGEELTDHTFVDISKVQMFFFTIAAVSGYAGALWNCELPSPDGSLKFPALSSGLVTLLGISHAGYLTVKAAPKTPTA